MNVAGDQAVILMLADNDRWPASEEAISISHLVHQQTRMNQTVHQHFAIEQSGVKTKTKTAHLRLRS